MKEPGEALLTLVQFKTEYEFLRQGVLILQFETPIAMNMNPYGSPAEVETLEKYITSIPSIADRFDAGQRLKLRIGLRMAAWGHTIVLFCVAESTFHYVFPSEKAIISGIGQVGAGIGLIIILLGVLLWSGLPGREKIFALLAVLVQVIAMLATSGYLIAAFNGRFVGGLFMLFGASAFSMLLTSQAIVALVNRSWAAAFQDQIAVHAGEFAVVGYAICASACAVNAIQWIPAPGQVPTVRLLANVFGILALVLQMVAFERTLRSFRTAGFK
jgi:hypothetical protein